MNNRYALVSRLIPFPCVDEPGGRLALFLQGCNLRCKNCHSPQTMGRCNDCGECVLYYPYEALDLSMGKVWWQPGVCQQCDTCLYMYPQQATLMTQGMSVDEVLQHIRKTSLFIEGVAVSGDEATTQLPFIVALFTATRTDPQLQHLACMVDSNNMLSETGWQKLLPVCNGVMLGLKAWDSTCYRQLTDRDNMLIRQSITFLSRQRRLAELHLLVIPGQEDYLQHIDALATFIERTGDIPIRLNAFHAHGVYGEAKGWPSTTPKGVEHLAQRLRERGVDNLILPALYL